MSSNHPSINAYMWAGLWSLCGDKSYRNTQPDTGIVSTVIAQPEFLEYFSPFTHALGAVIALIAGIIQAATVHVGVLLASRVVGGFAVGIMNMTIQIYNSEIAPSHKRGLIAGLHAQFVRFGFTTANWVAFGCSYSTGEFQWRFPLAFQCVPVLIILECDHEALTVIKRLHGGKSQDDVAVRAEFHLVREQLRNRKRLILAVLVQAFTQLSGINVINYYQTDLYKGLGMEGHNVTLLAGIYGLVGPLANLVCLYYVDSWGCKKTLWITGIAMALDMALVMGLSGGFVDSDNMIMSMTIRAKGSSISVVCNVIINIIFNQVSPVPVDTVGYKYYALFVCTNIVGAVGKTLEEIGEIFGDNVVVADIQQVREKIEATGVQTIESVKQK
ncbi:uncharacterized protein BDV17DRAFT_300427 [Aspergillus undulatus]|uniref:uncharacterized protein n=1 Tax=Aspergillus undulatus TaxID=1810928 RepID=UPI003CCD266D